MIYNGIKETYNLPRQKLPTAYIQNGSVDVIKAKTIIEKNSMTGDIIIPFVMEEWESINIDTEIDFLKNILPKKRPDDFKWEVEHLQQIVEGKVDESPISLERGLNTMMVIAAAHLSYQQKRVMHIDYSKGYVRRSIKSL